MLTGAIVSVFYPRPPSISIYRRALSALALLVDDDNIVCCHFLSSIKLRFSAHRCIRQPRASHDDSGFQSCSGSRALFSLNQSAWHCAKVCSFLFMLDCYYYWCWRPIAAYRILVKMKTIRYEYCTSLQKVIYVYRSNALFASLILRKSSNNTLS